MSSHSLENIIIIGSGPAALTAAVYCARAGLKPLVIEGDNPGGQLMGTTYIENWPGEQSILGPSLMIKMRNHALLFGTRLVPEVVTKVELMQRPFKMYTNKNEYQSTSIIIATGATPKQLNCPGEQAYWGKGITTCAVCDGSFYKDKEVVIIGGGDTAMENASFMTNFTDRISIVHILPHLTASWPMQERILKDSSIKIFYESTVTAFKGNDHGLTHSQITNQNTSESFWLPTDGAFVAIGLSPNTELFKGQLELTKYGYIVVHDHTHTSIPGVFTAGDVADPRYRQAITSAGSGCAAALDAERYIKEVSL
jgi:thioredoxin reductase (NADPH)